MLPHLSRRSATYRANARTSDRSDRTSSRVAVSSSRSSVLMASNAARSSARSCGPADTRAAAVCLVTRAANHPATTMSTVPRAATISAHRVTAPCLSGRVSACGVPNARGYLGNPRSRCHRPGVSHRSPGLRERRHVSPHCRVVDGFRNGRRGRTAVDRAGELRLDARLGTQRNALQHRRQLLLAVDTLRVRPCSGTHPQASPDMRSRNRRRRRTPGSSGGRSYEVIARADPHLDAVTDSEGPEAAHIPGEALP